MHTVSGKLFKAPFIKVLSDSTMFAFKLSEVSKDRQTGEKVYANYDAVIFAKSQAQIDYYTSATSEGSFVVVSSEKLVPKISDCGKYVNLNMENARLENANYSSGQQGGQQSAPQQQRPPAQQPAPQMAQQAPAYQQQAPAPRQAPVPQHDGASQQKRPAPQQTQYAPVQDDFDDTNIPF